MNSSWEGNGSGSEHPVHVAWFRRHQAVCGKKNRSWELCKFFLLVLPCSTEVSFQVTVLFQFRISMTGKHFTVGVNINAFSFCLFQKKFQVMQVVTGNDDEWAFFHSKRYCNRSWCAVSGSVSAVKKLHAGKIVFTCFHYNRKKQVHIPVLAQCKKCFCEKFVYFCVSISKCHCMVGISRHSADSKENQRFQGADVFLGVPEKLHIVVVVMSARGSAAATVWAKPGFFLVDAVCDFCDGFVIEAYVGKGSKQTFHHQFPCGFCKWCILICCMGESDESSGKFILKSGCISGFSTDSFGTCTAGTSGSLFTLKTKHVLFHK